MKHFHANEGKVYINKDLKSNKRTHSLTKFILFQNYSVTVCQYDIDSYPRVYLGLGILIKFRLKEKVVLIKIWGSGKNWGINLKQNYIHLNMKMFLNLCKYCTGLPQKIFICIYNIYR